MTSQTMTSQPEQYIALIDESLRLMRGQWLAAPVPQKAEHMARIERWLDERLKFMHLRDEARNPAQS
jgi:hypothetical protein